MFIIRKTILYMQLYVMCFSCIYAISLVGWRMSSSTSSNLLEMWAGLLDCRPHVRQYRWRCTSHWRWLEEIKHGSLARQQLFFTLTISSQQAFTLFISRLIVAAHCSFQSMSSNTLMPDALNLRPSVNLKPLMVLSDSDSDSSASSTTLCFNFIKMVELELLMMAV